MKHTLEIQGRLYVSSALLSERYGVSSNALWKWHKRGLLPPPIRLGRRNYYIRDEVEARLAEGE
jgi:DNA-binding transcriptional MerR regulator